MLIKKGMQIGKLSKLDQIKKFPVRSYEIIRESLKYNTKKIVFVSPVT